MQGKKYKIQMSVPLGIRNGIMYLKEIDGKLSGWIDVLGYRKPLSGEKVSEGIINLLGELQTAVSTFSFSATGTVAGEQILLRLKTKTGVYALLGKEVSADEENL